MSKIIAKESQNVEYKRSWQDEYLKWICGFANAQGAVIYFGVDDNLEVYGLKNTKKLMEDIPNKIVNSMGIVVDVNLHEEDGLEYIEVIISPSNVPISYKGKYYYRSGSTMQELNGAALQQFILKKMGRTWDDIPNDYATIKDLDRKAIKYFLENGIASERIDKSEAKASTQRVLENLGLPMPIIESADGGVRVTFQRNNLGNSQLSLGSDTKSSTNHTGNHTEDHTEDHTGLSRIQREILVKFKENPAYSRRELASLIENASLGGVISALTRLQELGIICHIGPAKGGRWEIINHIDGTKGE